MPYANNKGADQPAHARSLIGADQPAHARSLIGTFVVRCLDYIIPLFAMSKISKISLASAAEQARLSLTWSETPKTGFHVTWLISEKHSDWSLSRGFIWLYDPPFCILWQLQRLSTYTISDKEESCLSRVRPGGLTYLLWSGRANTSGNCCLCFRGSADSRARPLKI